MALCLSGGYGEFGYVLNNSIFYRHKPTREKLHWHLQQMRYSGEPGWINEEAGAKRRPNFCGCNPCGEILLDSNGLCNLTTLNVMAFVDENGALDRKELLEAQRLSARAGYRMTCRELEMHRWNRVQQRDRLLGCSLTGWQDMVNATGMSREEQAELLDELRSTARQAADELADRLGGNRSLQMCIRDRSISDPTEILFKPFFNRWPPKVSPVNHIEGGVNPFPHMV